LNYCEPENKTIGNRFYYSPHFWLIAGIVLLITIANYGKTIPALQSLIPGSEPILSGAVAGYTLYLIPTFYSYFVFGLRGGLLVLAIFLLTVLPEVAFLSEYPVKSFLAISGAVLGSGAVLFLSNLYKRQREEIRIGGERLELAHRKLRSRAKSAIEHEDRMAALTAFSAMLNQSMGISEVIQTGVKMVIEVMQVEVVILFSLDAENEELRVIAFEGVDYKYAAVVDRIKIGRGFCGRVAETGKPLLVANVSNDPVHGSKEAAAQQLQTQLSVPLQSRGSIIGTLCVATRSPRQFTYSEVELLSAIGNLIGVAMENSELSLERELAAEQLTISEKKYRQLFENAHDAIWVQDLSGKISAANKAAAALFGCTLPELVGTYIQDHLPQEGLHLSKKMQDKLLKGQVTKQPYTQKVIKKDGSEAVLMLTSNIVSSNGQPDGVQFIGRDITNEVRMQENQQFYLRQITKAHEEERLRISRDLHDSSAQNLIGILHKLENFCQNDEYLPMPKLRSLWSLHERLKDILQEIRQLSRDLRPSILDHLGLLPSVDWLSEQIRIEHKIDTELTVIGSRRRFSQEIEVALFRIIQEALRNVAKHSEATKAQVIIEFKSSKTCVTIKDNGKGFDLPPALGELSRLGKLGLDGMQTRAKLIGGTLSINSNPGEGTILKVDIPA